MYGKCPHDGAGSVAVGRVARSASNIAVVTGGVPVGDTGGGVRGGVTVGEEMGESLPGVGPIGENRDECGANSPSRAVRHTRNTITNPTTRPEIERQRIRRLTGSPQLQIR